MDVGFRRAVAADLPALVRMLADDARGAEPLPACYVDAFEAIDRDPNQLLLVAERPGHGPVGTLQITYTPGLSRRGAWRATIEGLRVAAPLRSGGLGRRMLGHAIGLARARGCRIVQLTSDKRRTDAIRFYESLGFSASHEGLKLALD